MNNTIYNIGDVSVILEEIICIPKWKALDANRICQDIYIHGNKQVECTYRAKPEEIQPQSGAINSTFLYRTLQEIEELNINWRKAINELRNGLSN